MTAEREGEEDESRLDLYAVLELPRDASDEDIRIAFRKIAAKNHPDRNAGDSKAALRFKRANAAYQVLSDVEKKELYDQLTTPVEELPPAPPAQALVRQDEAKGWRKPEEEPRDTGTRRVRRRVRRTRVNWTWGLVVGAVMVVLTAWLLVPDGNAAHVDANASPSIARTVVSPSAHVTMPDPVIDPNLVPTSPAGNARASAPSQPLSEEPDVPVRTVTGDRWSFTVPTDWQNTGDAKSTRWTGPSVVDGDGPSVSLVVSSFSGDSAVYFKSLERRTRTGVVVDAESWESETQPDGLRREGRVVTAGKVVSRFVEYAVPAKGRGFALTCTAPAIAFDSTEPLCERILRSLQIK